MSGTDIQASQVIGSIRVNFSQEARTAALLSGSPLPKEQTFPIYTVDLVKQILDWPSEFFSLAGIRSGAGSAFDVVRDIRSDGKLAAVVFRYELPRTCGDAAAVVEAITEFIDRVRAETTPVVLKWLQWVSDKPAREVLNERCPSTGLYGDLLTTKPVLVDDDLRARMLDKLRIAEEEARAEKNEEVRREALIDKERTAAFLRAREEAQAAEQAAAQRTRKLLLDWARQVSSEWADRANEGSIPSSEIQDEIARQMGSEVLAALDGVDTDVIDAQGCFEFEFIDAYGPPRSGCRCDEKLHESISTSEKVFDRYGAELFRLKKLVESLVLPEHIRLSEGPAVVRYTLEHNNRDCTEKREVTVVRAEYTHVSTGVSTDLVFTYED